MPQLPDRPILPITIVSFDSGRGREGDSASAHAGLRPVSPKMLSDLRHWQIEEFLRQTGKADNTQRVYKRQLKNFSAWCNKSWLDVTPSGSVLDLLKSNLEMVDNN